MFTDLPSSPPTASLRTGLTLAYGGSNIQKKIGDKIPDAPPLGSSFNRFRPKPNVRDMRESLQGRSVSSNYDEALCLSCNMGFEMELITGVEEEHMPTFWKYVEDIPVGLIFSTARKKQHKRVYIGHRHHSWATLTPRTGTSSKRCRHAPTGTLPPMGWKAASQASSSIPRS